MQPYPNTGPDFVDARSAAALPSLNRIAETTFIHRCDYLHERYFGHPTLLMVELRYDLREYSDGLYGSLGIQLPQQIARAMPRRKAEYLAGRCAAYIALSDSGSTHAQVAIGENRCPKWPIGYTGSISHLADRAICAVTSSAIGTLGVDMEQIFSTTTSNEIVSQILDAKEQAVLGASPYDANLNITLAFSAKEAFFKMAYPRVRRYFDFFAVELQAIDPVEKVITLMATSGLDADLEKSCYFVRYDVDCDVVRTISADRSNNTDQRAASARLEK